MEIQVATEPADHPLQPLQSNGVGQEGEGDGNPPDSMPDSISETLNTAKLHNHAMDLAEEAAFELGKR